MPLMAFHTELILTNTETLSSAGAYTFSIIRSTADHLSNPAEPMAVPVVMADGAVKFITDSI